MKRLFLLLAAMAVTLVVASGVALAVNKIGTNGPDTLRGTNGDDNLLGKGANDVLYALGGRDNLLGGEGKDWVLGGDERRTLGGEKTLVGGPGNDGVFGGNDSDNMVGGSGNDVLWGQRGSDRLVGGGGNDIVDGWEGSDRLFGGGGADLFVDGPFDDTSKDEILSGGDGDDAFFVDNVPATRDIVSCGDGFDRLAADAKDQVASDCEQVRRGPNAGVHLNDELEEEGLPDIIFEGLAPFPEG
ncbi:MAG: hypothetical protein M3385_08555 [Actinomycetota bacterium]|nr:hypothetical protein [Actinomycetota bacterium]